MKTQIQASELLKAHSLVISILASNFLEGTNWNITGGANNATITGLSAGVGDNDAVNMAQFNTILESTDYKIEATDLSSIVECTLTGIELTNTKWQKFNTNLSNPTHFEGSLFYDTNKKALSYYNEESEVTVNLGQAQLIRVYNNSGATIEKGKVVAPLSNFGGVPTIQLACACVKNKSRLVGVATHGIENNSYGYVTKAGSVSGIDTSSFTTNTLLYLSSDNTGNLTADRPTDGGYSVIIGAVGEVGVEGSIVVDIIVSSNTVEVTDTNGFPDDQRTNTNLSFVDATRTFTIAANSYPFHYYQLGELFQKGTSESIIIDNTEGNHVILYDEETLTSIVNPTHTQIIDAIKNKVLVAYIYWDVVNQEHSYFADERHGIGMSPTTHSYLHFSRGAQYLWGLGLGNINADDNGDLDTSAQFSIDSGQIADEDISTIFSSISSTVGLPIYYMEGVNNMRRTVNAGFSMVTQDGTSATRLLYNEWTGSAWQLTEVTNSDFVLCHVFAINGYEGEDQQIAIIGQNEYSSKANARAGASSEIINILSGFYFEEIVPIATVIFQTRDTYDNAISGRIISTDEGEDYVDWRTSELAQGTNPSDHNNLTNLQLTNTGVTWGHINDVSQTIIGEKTFNDDINITTGSSLKIGATQIITSQQSAIANVTGTATGTDAAIINNLISDNATLKDMLRTHGLIAT